MLASTALMGDLSVAAHSRATAGSGRTVVRPDQSGPLSVTPALDTARAVSATMAEDGGTLSVTAANGTTFTLTIPANALVSEEEITMTPVAAIPDLPFGQGLSGGGAVELAPEGLLLVQPATLVIHTPSPIAIDQQSPFAWYKAGEDFQLFPLTLDLNSVTMAVDHFNGYGIAAGASTDRAAVASHSPGRSEAQFTQQLEQQTEALRQKLSQSLTKKQAKKAMKNYNSQVLASFVAVFTDLDNQLVNDLGSAGGVVPQARPQAVAPSPAALRCDLLKILVTLINLRNQGKTVADLGSVGNPGLAAHITAALNALEIDSLARCQQGNAGEIGTLLGLARLALIFAALDPSLAGLSTVAKNIGNEAINCVHLKLTFDSTITQVAVLGLAVRVQIELEATVPLVPHISRLISPLPFYSGSAPLVHHIDQITNGTANPCSISDHSTDSTLEIRSMSFDIHLRLVECPGEDAAPATDLDMVIDTGQPLENFTMTCPPPAPGFSTPGNTDIWRAQFYCGHNLGTGLHSATQFFFKNFDMGKEVPGNLATKLFQHLVPPVCPAYEEFTVIKVNLAE